MLNKILSAIGISNNTKENNRNLPAHNTSGSLGVGWNKKDRRWRAQIKHNGKQIHLGNFIDKQDAIEARQEAEIKYNFDPDYCNR